MDVFAQRLGGIPRIGNVVLYCHLGIRSNSARAWVESQGIPISHLSGGIEAWLFENIDNSGNPIELANKLESDDSEPEKPLTLEEQNEQVVANAKMEAELEKIKTNAEHSESSVITNSELEEEDLKDAKNSLVVDSKKK